MVGEWTALNTPDRSFDGVAPSPILCKPPPRQVGLDERPDFWPDGVSEPAPRPPLRRLLANVWLAAHTMRRAAGILHAELRRVANTIEAEGGRGTETALAVLERLHRLIESVVRGGCDFAGSAVALCRWLGLDVCDRAAREAVRRIAALTPILAAGSRHNPCALRLKTAFVRGRHFLEADPLWRGTAAEAVSLWLMREISRDTSPTKEARAPGDFRVGTRLDLETAAAHPDVRLLGLTRVPLSTRRASVRMRNALARRGVADPHLLSHPQAVAMHRRLWWRGQAGLLRLPDLRVAAGLPPGEVRGPALDSRPTIDLARRIGDGEIGFALKAGRILASQALDVAPDCAESHGVDGRGWKRSMPCGVGEYAQPALKAQAPAARTGVDRLVHCDSPAALKAAHGEETRRLALMARDRVATKPRHGAALGSCRRSAALMDLPVDSRASSPACPAKSCTANSPSSKACPRRSSAPAGRPASPGPSSPPAAHGPASTCSGSCRPASSPPPSSSTCSAASVCTCP